MAGLTGTQASAILPHGLHPGVTRDLGQLLGHRREGETDGQNFQGVGFLEGFFWEPHTALLPITHFQSRRPQRLQGGLGNVVISPSDCPPG